MHLVFSNQGQVTLCDLDTLADTCSGIITIGQQCKQVWNAIAIDDPSVDPFQCHLIGTKGGPWRLHNGQRRINCPKGLLSSKTIPCNSCMGRCVNVNPGRPKYNERIPATATLINGKPVSEFGTYLQPGDTLHFGDFTVMVK